MSNGEIKQAFLNWVSVRKLVTRNKASLRMNRDESQFLDYRVNDLWCAWQAASYFKVNMEELRNEK